MQYQCTYDEIERGICYLLTTKANQKFTSHEILSLMFNEKICPEMNSRCFSSGFNIEFEEKCNSTSKMFPKIKKSGTYYSFSTLNPIDIEVVKSIVSKPSEHPTITFESIYADGETILHILCANGLYNYVELVSQSFNINPHMRNEAGQTLFDVVPQTADGHLTFKTLFNIFLTQEIVRTESKLNAVKDSNMALTKKNVELAKVNSEMITTNKTLVLQNNEIIESCKKMRYSLNLYRFYSTLQSILLALLISYIVYDKFQNA